jgi:CRISPR/Cas system-associated endonuclease Cas1
MELERALADIRLSPEPMDERTEELKQQYETVLTLLESEFLGALISGDWREFDQFVNDFKKSDHKEFDTSTKDLTRPGAGLSQTTNKPIVRTNH